MVSNLLRLACACLVLVSTTALASLVDVKANVGWSCSNGNGGFEAGCQPDVERGTLEFVYDTSVIDSDPNPLRGLFTDAFVSFRMIVEQQTRPDLIFTLAGANTIALVERPTSDFDFILNASTVDASGSLGAGSFRLQFFNPGYLGRGGNANALPDSFFWSNTGSMSGNGYGAGDAGPVYGISASSIASPVPEPSTWVMFAVGLAILGAARRRLAPRPVLRIFWLT